MGFSRIASFSRHRGGSEAYKELPPIAYRNIYCGVHAREYVPAIGFSLYAIKIMARIGVEIDVDMYCELPPDE